MKHIKTQISNISNAFHKKTLTQVLRYLVTGSAAFSFEYGLYIVLLNLFQVHYLMANVVVYVFVFWFIFLVNRYWSFQSTGDIKKQLFQYALLFIFNLIVANIILMYLFTDVLGISPYISPVLKMFVVICWNFLIYKYVIYK